MPQEIKDTDCCGSRTCCCCFSLRTGCIILGVLGVLGGAFGIVGASVVIGLVEVQAREFAKYYQQQNQISQADVEVVEAGVETVTIIQSVHLVLAAVSLIINSLMLHGAIKGKHRFILPYLVYTALQMILGTAVIIGVGVYIGMQRGGERVAPCVLVAVPFLGLGVYIWNAVRRHYKDLKQGELQPADQENIGTFSKGEVAYVKMID